jgi:hypothetical protein
VAVLEALGVALRESTMTLAFYRKEREDLSDAYANTLSQDKARIIISKLAHHYKLRYFLRFTNRVGGGRCHTNGLIELRTPTNIGIICHELAHLYLFRKVGKHRHGRQLARVVTRFATYCKRKGYWAAEVGRRTQPKLPKPVPTAQDVREGQIASLRAAIGRYEKRLAYYTRLYRGKIGRKRRSLAMLLRPRVRDG